MSGAAIDLTRSDVGQPTLLSAGTIEGDDVCSLGGDKLGTIQDLMLDIKSGEIRYAVLSTGGFLGMGDRLFAIPWSSMRIDGANKRFMVDLDQERLKDAPGFDKDNWPDWSDVAWSTTVDSYFGSKRASTS